MQDENRLDNLGIEGKTLDKAVDAVRMTVEVMEAQMPNQVSVEVSKDSRVVVGRDLRARIVWSVVEWEEQDVVIALKIGCSRERVRQKRNELGLGKSPMWHKRQDSVREDLREMVTEDKTLDELAMVVGCKGSHVKSCLDGLGKGYVKVDRRMSRKYRWDLADWMKTDDEVALALGVKNAMVVSQYRYRHGIWKRADKIAQAKEQAMALAVVER